MTIFGYHIKKSFVGQESGYLLVEVFDFSGNHHSSNAPYINNSQNFWHRSKKMGHHFSQAAQ